MVTLHFPLLWFSKFPQIFLGTGLQSIPSLPSPSPTNEPHYTFDELYNLQVKFFDNFIYPADITQAKSINLTLLAEDVQGRIDITRTFDGRELNTEYLFGLFANIAADPNSISLLGIPISYEILHFAANKYITSAATRFMFNFTSLGMIVPVEIDSWKTWNEAGQITQYDGSFKHSQWMVDYIISLSASLFNATSNDQAIEILTKLLSSSICKTAISYCNGTNTQYSSMALCYQHLTQEVRFGKAYEFGRNTVLCRMVHQNMVPFRPSVHCPHIGPSGGGYCTDDMTYVETVEEDYFNIPFIPSGKEAAE